MIWPVWVLPCPLLLATTLRRAPLHPLFCPLRAAEQEGGGGFTRHQLAEAAGLLVRSRVRRERNVTGRLCLHEGLGIIEATAVCGEGKPSAALCCVMCAL